MNTKLRALAALLVIAAFGLMPAAAQALGPHWFQKHVELEKIGEPHKVVTTKGVVGVFWEGKVRFKCRVEDKEVIWNPESGGPGEGEVTQVLFGKKCSPAHPYYKPCKMHELLELEAELPWGKSKLVEPSVGEIRDEITGIKLIAHCSVSVGFEEEYVGTLAPEVGVNALIFGPGSGQLEELASSRTVFLREFTDKLKAPGGKIEAE